MEPDMTEQPQSYLLSLFRKLQELEVKPLERWSDQKYAMMDRREEIEVAETRLAREILDCATRNTR